MYLFYFMYVYDGYYEHDEKFVLNKFWIKTYWVIYIGTVAMLGETSTYTLSITQVFEHMLCFG